MPLTLGLDGRRRWRTQWPLLAGNQCVTGVILDVGGGLHLMSALEPDQMPFAGERRSNVVG
jgi:hypothetical protein